MPGPSNGSPIVCEGEWPAKYGPTSATSTTNASSTTPTAPSGVRAKRSRFTAPPSAASARAGRTSRSASRFRETTATAISSAIDCTARTSRIATESTSSLPRPGYANRYSTTITPPIRYCRFWANTCTAGASALRSAWRQTTRRSGKPLRRAISANSARSAWIIPARVMRTDAASVAPSSVSTGSTSRRRCASGLWPGSSSATGRQRIEPREQHEDQQRADHELRQRDDRERDERDRDVRGRPACRAATTPSRSESGIMSSAVMPASQSVALRRGCTWLQIETLLPAAKPAAESPRSPWTKPEPVGVAHRDRAIEAHVLAQLRDLGRRRRLAEHGGGGIARAAPRCRRRRASRRRAASRSRRRRGAAGTARSGGCSGQTRRGRRRASAAVRHAHPRPRARRRGSSTRRG